VETDQHRLPRVPDLDLDAVEVVHEERDGEVDVEHKRPGCLHTRKSVISNAVPAVMFLTGEEVCKRTVMYSATAGVSSCPKTLEYARKAMADSAIRATVACHASCTRTDRLKFMSTICRRPGVGFSFVSFKKRRDGRRRPFPRRKRASALCCWASSVRPRMLGAKAKCRPCIY